MNIRLAFPNEVDSIMTIIEDAKAVLASYGSDQWQDGYPTADVIIDDIIDGVGYVALEDGEVIAYAAAIYGNEEAYNAIYDGQWLTDDRHYITFHRIAVAKDIQGKGIAQTFVEGLIEGFDYDDFRCDTHEKNLAMQAILSKLGFHFCGKVPLAGVRLAYQKLKKEDEKTVKYQEIDEDRRYDF
ncbi:GNAT family acetyltransferase [Streptococcus porcinus]|uniref:GNAT family N-acetyltransferase n=1 Tax=Streptococcus porcinus TaxID=1340 RepID=UPI0010CAB275|nr:GNAT family N-acetyltransferase [Streptococcus porcinus]VTS37442.1 GNAT family acetyltransferase [Streptococcus porcinus]